jgi:hypothetical protein
MGARGPVGKRDDERRRRNKPETPTTTVDLSAQLLEPVEIPAAGEIGADEDREWHPIARLWYESLAKSGQAVFYEPSDWAAAYVLAETLSRELHPHFVSYIDVETGERMGSWVTEPIKGASLTAILKGMTALMVTEGDRRRLSIELERKRDLDEASAVAAGASSISQQRQRRFEVS